MSAIRLGVIGPGSVFEHVHWPVLKTMPALFRLAGIAGRSAKRTQAIARNLGVRAYPDYRELMADPDVDAVLAAVPIDLNHVVLLDAVRSGKHVLAEKPIAATPEQARAVLAEISPRRVVAIGENFRYRKDLALARRILAQGILGEITSFQMTMRFDMQAAARRIWSDKAWRREPRYPGGYLLDTGVHAVSYLRDLLGDVAEVFAQTLRHNPALGGPEGLLMQLRLENGRLGQYFACYSAKLEGETALDATIYGSQGTMEITPGRVAWSHGPDRRGGVRRTSKSDRGYERQWRNFAHAIRGDEALVSTPQEAYRDLLVIDAALQSAAGGRVIQIPPSCCRT